MKLVIFASVILFVIIIWMTIYHITGGYKAQESQSDIDPEPMDGDKNGGK